MTDLQEKVIEAVKFYVDLANELYDLGLNVPEISFNMRGRAAGQFKGNSFKPTVRFNRILLEENGQAFIDQTVPHEVAHYVIFEKHGSKRTRPRNIRPHGWEWQKIMRDFGCSPKRCHSYDTSNSRQGRRSFPRRQFVYACACQEHKVGPARHRRIQTRERTYTCRNCGTPLTPESLK
jgi:SprT protein